MKHCLLLLSVSFSFAAYSQSTANISTNDYNTLKKNGQLEHSKNYILSDNSTFIPTKYKGTTKSPSSICSCMVPLDSTFTIAMAPNDDGFTSAITLPFSYSFFGTPTSTIYINNNGNISLNTPYSTFSSFPFPDPSYQMVAPFWADVDTRDSMGGAVYYKITPTAMIVKWEAVGYFSMHSDLVNTFQLIITDGTDPILPAGTNVSFCYGDMQWTTGDASSGFGGFGGTPATVGTNAGDSLSYFQVGRFDSAGVAFDGPYGLNDGVDWLDNQGMYFNTGISGNIPPVIINNNICDTIDVYTGDTTHSPIYDVINFTVDITTPEPGQTVSTVFTTSDPLALTVSSAHSIPTYQQFNCSFSAIGLSPGLHNVTVTATDNGTPALQTVKTYYIRTHYDPLAPTGINEASKTNSISIFPNPSTGLITVNQNINQLMEPILNLVDVLGKSIMKNALTANQQTIDISGLPQGIYFATIISKNGVSKTMKIVKK